MSAPTAHFIGSDPHSIQLWFNDGGSDPRSNQLRFNDGGSDPHSIQLRFNDGGSDPQSHPTTIQWWWEWFFIFSSTLWVPAMGAIPSRC